MKRGFAGFIVMLVLCSSLAFAATPYSSSSGYHPLQQVTTDQTGTTSVDANSNGIIDMADSTGTFTGDSIGSGTTDVTFKVKGGTNLWTSIDFYNGAGAYWGMGKSKAFGDYRDNDFYIDRTGVRRALTIDATTLNVGIDNDNPQQKLDVSGTIQSTGIIVSSGTVSLPAGQIDSAEISDSAVTSAKISDATIATADIADGAVTLAKANFNYAGSSSKGGAATDVGCTSCVALGTETSGAYDTTPDTIADDGTITLGTETTGAYVASESDPKIAGGTANSLTKWASATSLGNSGIIDDGSNVYLPARRVAFNGGSITTGGAYGIGNGAAYYNLNSIAVDTLETDGGYGGGGTLELNYYGGNEVHIGPSGSKPLRASILYDGSSGYYADPNSNSRMAAIYSDNDYTYGWFRNLGGRVGLYSENYGTHLYWDSASYLDLSTNNGMRFRSTSAHDSALAGYVYHDSTGFGMLSNRGSWMFYSPANSENVYFPAWGNWISSAATHRGEGTNFVDYSRYVYNNGAYSGSGWVEPSSLGVYYAYLGRLVYNNGAYSGSGWVEPSDLGVRYASSSGNADTVDGYHESAFVPRDRWWGSTYYQYNGDIYQSWAGLWLSTILSQKATHRGEGTNFVDYSWAMYDAYRGGWRTSNDLQVAYAYNAGYASNADTVDGYHASSFATQGSDVSFYRITATNGLSANNYIISGAYVYATSWVGGTQFITMSDVSLKKDIKPIPNALENIKKLRGVQFTWKKDDAPSFGLIAQEVEKVYPQLVHTNNETGLKSIEYSNLVGPLIEAIKEQEGHINAQQQEIDSQQNKIDSQQQSIEELQQQVKELMDK